MEEVTILNNGNIYPSASDDRVFQYLAISGSRIIAAGGTTSANEWENRADRMIDLHGLTVLPGFTDAHIHLEKYAHSLTQVDCATDNLDECLERIKSAAQQTSSGEWIRGHGWDQNPWGRFGTMEELDAVAPNNPVYLTAKSLHAAWINSHALAASAIPDTMENTPGGRIGRSPEGHPKGILFEEAMKLVSEKIPPPTLPQTRTAIHDAQTKLLRYGLTSVHDFDGQRCFSVLQELRRDDKLHVRVTKNLQREQLQAAIALGLRSGFGDDWIQIGHLKLFSDGALGPQTAAMLAPYESQPENVGLLLLSKDEIVEIGIRAGALGLPLAVHAIGDMANRTVIEALLELNKDAPEPSLPHRIEHLQVVHPADLEQLPGAGLTISMQPLHAASDRITANRFWGERTDWSYAWKAVHETGSLLVFGSDAPVEPPDPFQGLYAAVTRKLAREDPDAPIWLPEQCLDLSTALQAYTVNPPIAVGRGSELGRLEPGFFADLIVLDRDPYTIPYEEIPEINILGSMSGGVWRFLEI